MAHIFANIQESQSAFLLQSCHTFCIVRCKLQFFIVGVMNISSPLRPSHRGTKMCSFPSVACPFAGWTCLNSIDKTCVRIARRIGGHLFQMRSRLPFAKSSIDLCMKRTCGQFVSRHFFFVCLAELNLRFVFALCRAVSAL